MKLKVSLQDPIARSTSHDVLVTLDTTVSVGSLADAVSQCRPAWTRVLGQRLPTLRIGDESGRTLARSATVAEAGVCSGQVLALVGEEQTIAGAADEPAAILSVLDGPDRGKNFPLREGSNHVGRDRGNEVRLNDPLVSKQHARINVSEIVEIVDLGSSNGVEVGGGAVDRAVLRPQDRVLLGDTRVQVLRTSWRSRTRAGGSTVGYNRSPVLRPLYEGKEFPAPDLPGPLERARLPLIPLIAPVLLGGVMFAVTQQLVTVLFLALSPVLLLGTTFEGRRSAQRAYRAAVQQFHDELEQLDATLGESLAAEAAGRRAEQPSVSELVQAASRREPLLWGARRDRIGFLQLRFGLGSLPTRHSVALSPQRGGAVSFQHGLAEVLSRYRLVDDVPVTVDLRQRTSIGVAGPRNEALAIARSILAQLVIVHSPADVVLAALASSTVESDWDWLKWLPHVGSEHSPIDVEHLASTPAAALQLATALEEEVERRCGSEGTRADPDASYPAIIVFVDDDAPAERSRLVEIGERGGLVGIHLIWVADAVERLPAVCAVYVAHQPGLQNETAVGDVIAGTRVAVKPDVLDAIPALTLARSLAPIVDAGARIDDDSDLPQQVSLVQLLGPLRTRAELDGKSIVDRWRTSGSLPPEDGASGKRSKPGNLRALVGVAANRNLVLDLREHGPHALVGGTTGSGKSEFLQSWIMAMAAEHSPTRVTFLFVDYKGGAAFSECVKLPHSVGLVTDLTPHLVARVLTSLKAELRHREAILHQKGAKDLVDLETRNDSDAPPSLVIVVDEFAALVSEVPQFVDGVVNVAQRGRSLGLHLILATQRPAGVIRDNLRANTNLRIALRMADSDDSTDVVGSSIAGGFDPSLPGRAIAKMGPGRLTPFQSAYTGGWTPDVPPPPPLTIENLVFGQGSSWTSDENEVPASDVGPNDLQRLVVAMGEAQAAVGLPVPRRPWLDPLPAEYDLADLMHSGVDSALHFALQDEPDKQRRTNAGFFPDRDGNMAVFGTGGAGKTVFLKTIATVAGLARNGGPCHVYGLDFGTRGLQILEELDHVGAVVSGDDQERTIRVLRMLRHTIDDRAARYAAVSAASIVEYRERSGQVDEPRLLVVVDGIGAFRQAYETGPNAPWFDAFQAIAAEGRPVGVHVILSADRPGAVPTALASVIQRRLVLRLASENDYSLLGTPTDAFAGSVPPGRGFIDGMEVQVAVGGGTSNTSVQAESIRKLAGRLRRVLERPPAPTVERLAESIPLQDLPVDVGGLPVLGVSDDTLQPVGFNPDGFFLVVGPAHSGRTSAVATIALSLRRWRTSLPLVHLTAGSSPLEAAVTWSATASGTEEVAALAKELCVELAVVSPPGPGPRAAIVVEGLAAFAGTAADEQLQELFKLAATRSVVVITEMETSVLTSFYGPLAQPFKAARHGLALQPDQIDGDNVFKTTFPRLSRKDFPPGRGMYVTSGRSVRLQVAVTGDDT